MPPVDSAPAASRWLRGAERVSPVDVGVNKEGHTRPTYSVHVGIDLQVFFGVPLTLGRHCPKLGFRFFCQALAPRSFRTQSPRGSQNCLKPTRVLKTPKTQTAETLN